MKNRTPNSRSGLIPVAVIVSIAIVSMLFGAGILAFLSGSAQAGIVLFVLGVIVGLVLLPNLNKVIKWFKNVKKEL